MRAVGRILMLFIALVLIGGALFLALINYDLIPGLNEAFLIPAWAGENVMIAGIAILALIAIVLLAFSFRPAKKTNDAVLKSSEHGEVVISIAAVEDMVLRIVQQINGIKDISRKVVFTNEGFIINISIGVKPDVALPGLISDLQARTKEYVEEITGIKVLEVKVNVENLSTEQSSSKS
ncbi:MAG: alkaline shock response membrane anchor protein AmaP [Bacillota bacterium]